MRLSGLIVAAALAASACGSSDDSRGRVAAVAPAKETAAAGTSAAAAPAASGPRIVVLGDSLTAGLGLSVDQSYPALLQARLKGEGSPYQIINAGVSGDTSAGGLARLDWALEGDVRVLIVALGGNDGLRGLPAEELKGNLSKIIEQAQKRHIKVILAGMEAPPNFGQSYIVSFHQVYPELAREYNVTLVPFLLQGVAGIDTLNQRDGIHPTAQGARILAGNIWPVLRPMLTTS